MLSRLRLQMRSYSAVVIVVATALLLKLALEQFLEFENPFLLFFPAIIVTSWYRGFRAGLLTTALATIAAYWDIAASAQVLSLQAEQPLQMNVMSMLPLVTKPGQSLQLALFFLEGGMVSVGVSKLRSSQRSEPETAPTPDRTIALQQAYGDLKTQFEQQSIALKQATATIASQMAINETVQMQSQMLEWRSAFLAEASSVLASSLDYETTLKQLVRLTVPFLADYCLVHQHEPDESVRLLAAAHRHSDKQAIVEAIGHLYQRDRRGENDITTQVLQTGKAVIVDVATYLTQIEGWEDRSPLLRQLQPKSAMVLPLKARGKVFGMLTLVRSESDRAYTDADLSFAADLAHCAALAVDNAQLYQEARQASYEQAESLALIDALLAAAPIAICFFDRELRYIRINQVLASINGLPVEQHLGRRFRDLFPDMADRFEAQLQQVLDTGKPVLNVEVSGEVPGKPGEYGDWLGNYYPVCDRAGQTVGVGVMLAEITATKQAQAAEQEANRKMQETNQTLQTLVQACPLAITTFSLEDGKVKLWNPAAEQIFGWTEAESVGQFLPSVAPDQQAEFLKNLAQIQQGQTLTNLETRRQRKDGSVIDVGVWAAPLRDAQGKVSCMSIVADISERKRTEAERDQLLLRERAARAEAEALNRMKDEFLAVLSHELRTPLNAILGWAQLLQMRQYDEATTRHALGTIERNARSQAHLIEDLLDASRMVTGKLQINPRWAELNLVIAQAIDTLQCAALQKSIHLEANLPAAPISLWIDPKAIQQVLWNLLSNAIKFTPTGGKVTLHVKSPHPTPHTPHPNSQIQIIVTDTGQGITPQFLPYVFDRFRQADGATTRRHGGLGLGLAIARHLVELHHGTIEASSQGEGQGSTFTVILPLQQPDSA